MPPESARSRFCKVMAGELPGDRLPMIEWASWWNLTVERWQAEGLPSGLDKCEIKAHFHLDMDYQLWMPPKTPTRPAIDPGGERHWIESEADYDALVPELYAGPIPYDREAYGRYAAKQAAGQAILWITFSGFFWWPRVLFGITPHLYAFYDLPELMHRINQDLALYMLRCLDDLCQIGAPVFMTFAEDMSYNHGPMISKEHFEQFMAPYYRQVVPRLKEAGIIPLIDSDGQIEPLIPWFEQVGLDGILPLERMAGVDINRIRANHPRWCMIGGFDKTVMHRGEAHMRAEFERLLPAMGSGYYIPSVDHQTPPEVSMKDYWLYLRLLREYTARACQ